MAFAGKEANVYITSQTATTSTGEAFTLVSGSSLAYRINSTAARHWDRDPSSTTIPAVYVGGSTVAPADYSVNHVQGIITFNSTQAAAVTADVEYLSASSIAEGREWSMSVDRDMFEVSTFDSSGWREYQQNIQGASVSVSRYWADSAFFDLMNVDTDFIVELYPVEAAGDRYEAYAFLTNDQVSAAVDGIVGESVDMTIDGTLYWTTA